MAPGVTTRAITRKAPTVCIAATVEAASRVKNTTRSAVALIPMERACASSKKTASRSRHFASSTARDTPPMIASCSVSPGLIASTLPMMMVWIEIAIGLSETMNSPSPKKAVKISPITASSLSPERDCRNSIASAARPPDRKAPKAKGRPSM